MEFPEVLENVDVKVVGLLVVQIYAGVPVSGLPQVIFWSVNETYLSLVFGLDEVGS